MQALRHASRRALRATEAMQEPCIAFARAYSSEAGPRPTVRLSKEERQHLASQFVEKFKAANNGQLPTMTLLKKEVGGSYDVLKEVIQGFGKGSSEPVASEETADLETSKIQKPAVAKSDQQGVKGAIQKSSAKDGSKKRSLSKAKKGAVTMQDQHDEEEGTKDSAEKIGAVVTMQDQHDEEEVTEDSFDSVKEGRKKQPLLHKEKESVKTKMSTPEDSVKDKKVPLLGKKSTLEISKSSDEVKSVKQADAKFNSDYTLKQKQSSVITFDTDEDTDDDSDVAAPEYQLSSVLQTKGPKAKEVDTKTASVVHNKDDEFIKSKLHPKEEDSKSEMTQKGLSAIKSVIQSMPKPSLAAGGPSFGSKSTPQLPPTTVLRIINLPAHISAQQLKALCEPIARVHGVRLRRGRIADVHFNVEVRETNDVLERLRKVPIGNTTLKVFPALRFSCDSNTSNRFIPRDVHQFRHVRNGLINAFEQRFKFLCFQVQDFRELHNLKVAK